MATLATQKITRAGLVNPAFSACAGGGDRFTPNDTTTLHVKNGSGGSLTVTVAATYKEDADIAVANVAVAVPAAGEARIGPFPAQFFQATDGSGLADITYSGVTSLTIAVLQLEQP